LSDPRCRHSSSIATACSSTANTSRAASSPNSSGSRAALSVEEVHDLFLGKTVDGVLDAIAARTGQRPSSTWAYNWAFATAHAFFEN
jgi:hypothetical protein